MSLSLVLAHVRWMVLELWRQPAYLVSTLAFPALFYLIFAVPESKSTESSNFLMASFAGFAFFGVVFLQFGVGLSQERNRTWYHFLKTLPFPSMGFLLARLLTSIFFALLAADVVFLLAASLTPMHLSAQEWFHFLAVLLLGSVTFCLMGMALGYWASEKASLPLGNLIYLPLSFAGGLWKPPEILPAQLQKISEYLPTRFYGNLLWASVQGKSFESRSFLGLGFYALVAGIVALWGLRRDYDRRNS